MMIQQEQYMNQILRAILRQNSPKSHGSTKRHRFLANLNIIFNTERVKNSRQHHSFSHKAHITIFLDFR